MVFVQLLGGVSATTGTGAPVDLGPPKCRAVLAVLALSVGEAVPVARLVDLVWGEDPPRTATKILQGYVARLRKALGAAAITRVGAAYRLDVEPDAVDVARFRRSAGAGDVSGALAAWTGTPLAGLDAPALTPSVDGLVEQWLGVVEQDLGRRVTSDPAAAVAPLTELTAVHPFREELWVLLMRALHAAGRQADALAAYQQARKHLVEELGIEPGPRLRELQRRVLASDASSGAPAAEPVAEERAARPTGTVTFGVATVVDAGRLWVEHRRKMALAVARLDALVRSVTEGSGGTVLRTDGETVTAVFHRADDAAAWATRLQVEADREPWPGGVDLRLCVGLHTGETQEVGGTYVGVAVHTAQRLADAGHAGQVLASGITAALLDRDGLRPLGAHRLAGVGSEQEILQLDGGDHPPLRTDAAQRGNLPRALVRMVGRDDELEAVANALDTGEGVVTLLGPGGIGKTTLALAAARRWVGADAARRAWLVELAEVSDEAEVERAVAEVLGVTEGPRGSLLDTILASLRSHPALLVLDNGEHVLGAAARVARAVAEHVPGARVLATSRERLGVPGEQPVPVAPLAATGAATTLFAERARAASGAFDLDRERPVVEQICRRLDGLPLAIELAAARVRTLTPDQLLERLDDRLRLLAGRDRTAAARHRTLRATIAWSHDLLSEDERRVFQRLSVFTGPFDLAAAEAVVADDRLAAVEVDHLLGDLVERSMVVAEPGMHGRRFRLLETLRLAAAEHLAADADPDAVRRRHASWCRAQVAAVGDLLTGHDEIDGVARLAELWPNLRAAVGWACAVGDRSLAGALVGPLVTEINLRRRAEIGDWAERILDLDATDDEVVFWLGWALHRHMQAGNPEAFDRLVATYGHGDHPLVRFARAYLVEDGPGLCTSSPAAVAWLRERGERHAADLVEMTGLASGLMTTGQLAELDLLASRMQTRFAADGPPTLRYFALGMLGYSAQLQGRAEDAARLFLEAAEIPVPAGTYAASRPAEVRAIFDAGDHGRAFRLLRDHVDDLLDADYVDVARLVAVEFIHLMAAIDRLSEAAPALAYLDTTGDFGVLARERLVAEAARRIDAAAPVDDGLAGPIDARDALARIRDTLDGLVRVPSAV